MIADVDGRAIPVAPLVLDDAGSLEAWPAPSCAFTVSC